MSDKIRIGIIGTGQIGKMHIERYQVVQGAEIVAICDINEAEAQRVSEEYGISHVYSDYREMLKRDDIMAVDVCLHNNFHAPVTISALQSGKHVYCEKPIAGSYADGREMCELAESERLMLHIQLSTLYRPETKAAKTLIDGGKLGRLYHARSTGFRRRGRPYVDGYGTPYFTRKETAAGGALLDMGVYHIAQMLYLLGNPEVTRISGKVYQEMEMQEERRQHSGFNVEEFAIGMVKFEQNLTLDIMEAWSVHMGGFEGGMVLGSEGGIRLPSALSDQINQPFSFHRTVCDMDMDSTVDLSKMDLRWHRLREHETAYDSSQHHWIAALAGQVPLLPTARIALNTMLISEGIYLSDQLGHEVSAEDTISHSKSSSALI